MKQSFEQVGAERFVALLPEAPACAELDARVAFSFGTIHSGTFESVSTELDVSEEFLFHLVCNPGAMKEPGDNGTKVSRKAHTYSSRSRTRGLTESARCAGIHVARSPSKDMARTTPASTNGSRGVA